MEDRPNLLLFMPDQLRADALGCFGSPVASTPNIDALAARGTRFHHAYSQHSVCSPSRASILTGWYPHVAGHRTLTHLIKPWEPNLFRELKDAGYHVAWAGERGDMFAPGVADASTSRRGLDVVPNHVLAPSPFAEGDPWFAAHYHGRRENAPDGSNTLDLDEATVQTAINWVTDGLPEPWVLFVALVFPHPPFVGEEPWFSLHDRASMPEPAPWVAHAKPAYMSALREAYGTGSFGRQQWAEVAATYHGMVSRIDDQLGRLTAAVERAGQLGRTMTWFFTDHGEYLGDHGLIEKWPSGQHDSLLRNPLIVAGPGVGEGAVCEEMVEMVDLLPTMLEVAGHQAGHTHFGRSLTHVLADTSTPHRDLAFSEGGFLAGEAHLLERSTGAYRLKSDLQHEDPVYAGKVASVRDQRFTYVHRLYEGPELYDRAEDPGETANLAGAAEHGETEAALRDAVTRWLLETTDVIPWDADPRFEKTLIDMLRAGQ
jgi:arylsulfatase A-like enzyme